MPSNENTKVASLSGGPQRDIWAAGPTSETSKEMDQRVWTQKSEVCAPASKFPSQAASAWPGQSLSQPHQESSAPWFPWSDTASSSQQLWVSLTGTGLNSLWQKPSLGADKALPAGESLPPQQDRKGAAALPLSPTERQIRATKCPRQGTLHLCCHLWSQQRQILIWNPPALVAISFLPGSAETLRAGLSSAAQQQLWCLVFLSFVPQSAPGQSSQLPVGGFGSAYQKQDFPPTL